MPNKKFVVLHVGCLAVTILFLGGANPHILLYDENKILTDVSFLTSLQCTDQVGDTRAV